MAKVLVVADVKQGVLKGSTAELLSKAKALGAQAATVAIGNGVEAVVPQLVQAGSDTQYIADDSSLAMFSAGPYASAVVDAAEQFGADMIWFGFSESGKAVSPRVAARLKAACATDITDVRIDGGQFEVIRQQGDPAAQNQHPPVGGRGPCRCLRSLGRCFRNPKRDPAFPSAGRPEIRYPGNRIGCQR
jgi:electron transfer flavoprotein alpha subunit